jgi:hypothetical protein
MYDLKEIDSKLEIKPVPGVDGKFDPIQIA